MSTERHQLFSLLSPVCHTAMYGNTVSLRLLKSKGSLKNLLKGNEWDSEVKREPSELGEIPLIKQLAPQCSAHSAEEQTRMKADLSGEETACSVSNSRWLIKVSPVLIHPRSVSVKLHAYVTFFFSFPSCHASHHKPFPAKKKSLRYIYVSMSHFLPAKSLKNFNHYRN